MSTAVAAGETRLPWRRLPWTPLFIIGLALFLGLVIGYPSSSWLVPGGVVAGCGTIWLSLRWPFTSFLIILGSTILLVVVRVIGLTSINLLDVLMLPVLVATALGGPRAAARQALAPGPGRERLFHAERRLGLAVIVFFALAALSLIRLATIDGAASAGSSGLLLVRAIQGLLIYPLCLWLLTTRERIEHAWRALIVAGVALVVVNIIGVAAWDVKRAGMTFFLNNWDAPLATPNEAATAALLVGIVLLIRQAMRPRWWNVALFALMILLLALTQSRAGILAWVTFGLLTLRRARPSQLLIGALLVAVMVPFLPETFWSRMTRSAVVEPGSFEALSMFQRFYGWQAAWSVFMDHPWIGVGYLGFRFVSHAYNGLGLALGTVENYYYEILVSMGIVGLAVLAVVIVRLFQVGREVGRIAPPGTLAYHMARFHTPFVLGLLVANLTADNFVGMAGLAQLALWTAVLVRSGHAAAAQAKRA